MTGSHHGREHMGTPSIYNLDYLGLVTEIIDDIDFVNRVNEHVGEDPPRNIE